MKVLYLDCFSGISGDMTLGALTDLGLDPTKIETELLKLPLEKEYELNWSKVIKKGISATKVDVHLLTREDHHHRHYSDIVKMIKGSELNNRVKSLSLAIFEKIGKAEGKIHNLPLEKVHFHEVGAVDSIVDIVGAAIAIDLLNIEQFYSSPVPVGGGKIKIDHGIYPVPAPATLEMLKGVPLQQSEVKAELVTPTGAGILSLVHSFQSLPSMKVEAVGYGAGTKDFDDHPNVLRVLLGDFR